MSYARVAARYLKCYCQVTFPDNAAAMESTCLTGAYIDVFDIVGTGSHKYVPADRLSADLGMRPGAGVYGYVKFSDGSYLLQTCKGPLGVWAGDDTPAVWL